MFFGVFLSSLDLSSHVIVAQQLGATIVCIRDQRISEHANQPWSRKRRCKDAEEEKGMSANAQLATETDDKDVNCLF